MRMLASAGVLVGFCGGGGTPLLMATEVEWLSPQSEYRPTKYLQGWIQFWFYENKRLQAAKILQQQRIKFLKRIWTKDRDLRDQGFQLENALIKDVLILPWAFISAKEKSTEQEFRQQCLQAFTDHRALEFMFHQLKDLSLKKDWEQHQ